MVGGGDACCWLVGCCSCWSWVQTVANAGRTVEEVGGGFVPYAVIVPYHRTYYTYGSKIT